MKRLSLLLLMLLFLSSCGRKAPPLPVEKSIPEEASLEIEATSFGFDLWITLPSQTKGGFPLNQISYLEIERKEEPEFFQGKSKTKTIKIKPRLHSAGRLFLYTDKDLKPGFKYTYRLRIKKDFLVGTPFYAEKTLYWLTPPTGIKNFSLKPGERGELFLTWAPPSLNLKGEPLIGELFFNLERTLQGKRDLFELEANSFKDKWDGQSKVCYRVRALLGYKGTSIPGPFSEPLCYP